jgi:predicted RNase H-like HicB family nuclease
LSQRSTDLYVGFVPGFPGAHSQGETIEELNRNLNEVIELQIAKDIDLPIDEFIHNR